MNIFSLKSSLLNFPLMKFLYCNVNRNAFLLLKKFQDTKSLLHTIKFKYYITFSIFMANQLSSLDIHFLIKELKTLEGSRVDRIYNSEKEEIYIQFHKSNVGKKVLRFIVGKAMFLTEKKNNGRKPV